MCIEIELKSKVRFKFKKSDLNQINRFFDFFKCMIYINPAGTLLKGNRFVTHDMDWRGSVIIDGVLEAGLGSRQSRDRFLNVLAFGSVSVDLL
jgi:hypothetical protein